MTTLLELTFLAVGSGYTTTKFNPNIPKMVMSYKPNPNNSTNSYCYLEGSLQLNLPKTIPCDRVTLVDAVMRGTHASTNDGKSPFYISLDFLKCYNNKDRPLDNSFTIEPCMNNDQARKINPIVFTTSAEGVGKRINIRMRQVQYTDTLGSAEFGTDDAFVISLKFQVPIERL